MKRFLNPKSLDCNRNKMHGQGNENVWITYDALSTQILPIYSDSGLKYTSYCH